MNTLAANTIMICPFPAALTVLIGSRTPHHMIRTYQLIVMSRINNFYFFIFFTFIFTNFIKNGGGPSPCLFMLLLSRKHILHYFGKIGKKYFYVLKVALWECRRLGGPPRLGPGWSLLPGRRAGLKVGFAPWQFPADRLRSGGSWSPWELPSL